MRTTFFLTDEKSSARWLMTLESFLLRAEVIEERFAACLLRVNRY
jgi:hypothetical protein